MQILAPVQFLSSALFAAPVGERLQSSVRPFSIADPRVLP